MAHILATNVTSPLGMTTDENYRAVKAGRSALRRYEGLWGLPEPFTASLFTEEQQRVLATTALTRFESLVVHSVRQALEQLPDIDFSARNVIFILSTTKANIELLLPGSADGSATLMQAGQLHSQALPGEAARRIAAHLGFTTEPVVVCNACISGVAAIILAQRLLDGGQYDYALVCGADVQSRFTVAGFQSLKAVSANDCRPFDMERMGLNLGEAAATIVLSRSEGRGNLGNGLIRNDAFHISSPSKNGEGAWLALSSILAQGNLADLAFINAHGTATMFNDQMESVAIERAFVQGEGASPLNREDGRGVPVNGLKGYYGHTLGAAGVLETVISLAALRNHTILATRGFEERGVSGKISVTTTNATTDKTAFLKMISGFGGGNAAIMTSVKSEEPGDSLSQRPTANGQLSATVPGASAPGLHPRHHVIITPTKAIVDGQALLTPQLPARPQDACAARTLTSLYKQYVGDYPKFYKMDGLSRLGFIASELLLQAERNTAGGDSQLPALDRGEQEGTGTAIVLFNSSSSIDADRKFLETIAADNFFPSPSVFVYTLPNIVTGEIAMRNGYHGETSFFILPQRNDELMRQIVLSTLHDSAVKNIITGWVDYFDDTDYVADLLFLKFATNKK